MLHGRLGKVVGGTARVYNSRAQAFAILKRDPHATPVMDVLTYYVDLMCWFLEGNRPVEVVARGQHGIFKEAGYSAHDVTWAIVTFADGAVINLGVSYALPAGYPTLGQSDRVELLGTEGTMIIDDDHMDHLLYSEKGIPHAYVPDHGVKMAFLGSNTAGDWAVDDFWGPLGNETRAWLDHLSTGAPTVHTTPAQARINLETTIAIERAVVSGQPVRLPLQAEDCSTRIDIGREQPWSRDAGSCPAPPQRFWPARQARRGRSRRRGRASSTFMPIGIRRNGSS